MPEKTKNTVACSFCGGRHRNRSQEQRECRQRQRGGGRLQPAATTAKPKRPGNPLTHYQSDPHGGDKQAHSIVRKHRRGMSDKKIAKALDLPLARVRDVLEREAARK